MRAILPLILGLAMVVPVAFSAPAPLDDPVLNGGFEAPFFPDTLGDAISGSALDECIGIGHQIFYGSETWQHRLLGGPAEDADPEASDPVGAATQILDDPLAEGTFFAGYGHCVWSNEQGQDSVWANPKYTVSGPRGWSTDVRDSSTEFGYDLPGDEDPFNRAAMFTTGSDHNMWQSWTSPHQAYSGNHERLEFDVLNGEDDIPTSANLKISFSATPGQEPTPWVLLFFDCDLTLKIDDFDKADGRFSIDPVEGHFRSRSAYCDGAAGEWQDAVDEDDDEAKRNILGRLRMVQLSFWNWNDDYAPGESVVIDNVGITGATLFAEEVGN